MKSFIILVLFAVCLYFGFNYLKKDEQVKKVIVFVLGDKSEDPATPASIERGLTIEDTTNGDYRSVRTSSRERITGNLEKRPLNQYFDAETAFAKDQLFAVMSKRSIRPEFYTDHFDKTPFGNPTTKTHPAVYILRCLGRETRENYLFIVDRTTYDKAAIHEKFTKEVMSNFEFFLSEEKLESTIFSRRFRGKMID